MTPGDLRVLIAQGIGAPYLMPLIVDVLRTSPFIEGDLYPGDLLEAALTGPGAFYREHPEMGDAMVDIITRAHAALDMESGDYENNRGILALAAPTFFKAIGRDAPGHSP